MKTKTLLLILFFMVSQVADAQIMFQKHYGGIADDYGNRVLQTDDGGYLVAGIPGSYGAGGNDIYFIKTNEYGDTLWTKTYGGIGWDAPHDIKKTLNNCYIIAGETSSFGDGASDAFLMKIDSIGDSLWFKTYGGINDDGANSVDVCNDNSFIIVGATMSFGTGTGSIYLIKTDDTGDTLWTKTFGGTAFNTGYSVLQTLDGGYILSGFDMSEDKNMVIIKTNANGGMVWEKKYKFSGGLSYGTTIIKTVDGGYAIIGTQIDSTNLTDIKLLKVDANGDSLFAHTYGGINNEAGYGLIQTNDDGFVIAGLTESYGAGGKDVYLIKTDENGIEQWTKTFGNTGADWGCFVQQTIDNGYIIAGYTNSFGSNYDIYLIKTDENGVAGFEKIISTNSLLKIYPNPSDGLFTIQWEGINDRNGTIQVFNLQGMEVYKNEIYPLVQNKIMIDLSNSPLGLYIIRFTGKRTTKNNKIILY